MGVPDFLKFVARSSPGALCRLPRQNEARQRAGGKGTAEEAEAAAAAAPVALLEYDYVLIDATNVAQTITLERLYDFLCDPRLVVRKAVIFALDAGRTREGTARHHRQAHLMIGDLDVKVQQMCSSLAEHYRKRAVAAAKHATSGGPGKPAGAQQVQVPYVLVSGRNVGGEADYKVLDLQRVIITAALANRDTALPRFLFVSEDSDILCGAICGPAPQQVSIATNLRDTLFELCILRLEYVLAYVAVCVDALVGSAASNEAAAAAAALEAEALARQAAAEEELAKAAQAEELAAEAAQEPAQPKRPEEDVVRRRKVDGPMVAAGTRVTLDDSSSDDDHEEEVNKGGKAVQGHKGPAALSGAGADGKAAAVGAARKAVREQTAIPQFDLAAGKMVQGSCVDLVFLFVVVMGNGVNVPPLVRGVTKVDIASCWQSYCKHKFSSQGALGMGGFITQEEREMGRTLLSPAADDAASSRAELSLNTRFLLAILESVHYADAQSRPPVEEEKNRAIAYLSNAVYATLRYVVACNVNNGAALQDTFLDSRPLAETEVLVPSLAAVLWVLGQDGALPLSYPLQGLAKRELLALSGSAMPTLGASSADKPSGGGSGSSMELCVGSVLVCPPSTSASAVSWAMARGGGGGGDGVTRTFTLQHVVATQNTVNVSGSRAAPMRGGVGSASSGLDAGSSVAALVRSCAQCKNTYTAMVDTWRRSVALAVPELQALAKKSLFMSPVTGNIVKGPLAAADSAGGAKAAATSEATTKLVYSFELRRMTPLLTAEVSDAMALHGKPSGSSSAAAAAAGEASAPAAPLNPAQAALQAALGISFNYAERPPEQQNVIEDPELLQEINPIKRSKRRKEAVEKAAGITPAAKVAKTEGDTDDTSKYKRPGKRERQRLQQERKQQGSGNRRPANLHSSSGNEE